MSELSISRTDASPLAPRPRAREDQRPPTPAAAPGKSSALEPDAVDALVRACDAVREAPLSREALRRAVIRAAGAVRDVGASAAEATAAIELALAAPLGRLPRALAAELRVHVAWWAAHGYHRGD